MGLVEMNDALQRACPAGHWVWWRSMFVAGNPQTEVAYVANSHASTELGASDEPLEELLLRLPDMCEMVDALKADKMLRRGY